jgi:hypothetical protein
MAQKQWPFPILAVLGKISSETGSTVPKLTRTHFGCMRRMSAIFTAYFAAIMLEHAANVDHIHRKERGEYDLHPSTGRMASLYLGG